MYFPFNRTKFMEAILKHSTVIVIKREGEVCTCCSAYFKVNEEGHGFPIKELLDIQICNMCWKELTRYRNW